MTRAASIVSTLLEAEDEFDPEAVAGEAAQQAEVERDRSASEIRYLVPEFFSRSNNRAFGTKARYFLKGNYVLLKNVRSLSGGWRSTDYVLYKLVFHDDTQEWDLMFQESFKSREAAKEWVRERRAGQTT